MRALLLGQTGRAALAVTAGVMTVLSSVGLLFVSGALISGAALKPESLLVLLPLITAVRLFGLSRAALRYLERLVSHDLTFRLLGALRAELVRRLAPLAPAALEGTRGGDLLARVRGDVDDLQNIWLRLLAPTLVAVVVSALTLLGVFSVSPALAAVVLVLYLLGGLALPAWAARAAHAAGQTVADERGRLSAGTLETLRGLPDVLGNDASARVLARLESHLGAIHDAESRRAAVTASAGAAQTLLGGLGLIAALVLVGQGVASGEVRGPLLAAVSLGVLASFEAIGQLAPAWATYGAVTAARARVDALAHTAPAVREPASARTLPSDTTLRFHHVTFRYPGVQTPVLHDFDLTIRPGERVALVGSSGAGKSTVTALALRFRDPEAGRVSLGGVDLRDLALPDVRSVFAWAGQHPELDAGTVREHLRMARTDADDAALHAALHAVNLGGWLASLPAGLDTWTGEYGARLSAGERARLAVARALLRDAPILVLDEPTAHLDEPNARAVLQAAEHVPPGRSVLLVTQQPHLLGPHWRVVRVASTARLTATSVSGSS